MKLKTKMIIAKKVKVVGWFVSCMCLIATICLALNSLLDSTAPFPARLVTLSSAISAILFFLTSQYTAKAEKFIAEHTMGNRNL